MVSFYFISFYWQTGFSLVAPLAWPPRRPLRLDTLGTLGTLGTLVRTG